MTARIFVVATPLGNREDLSSRARQVLQEAQIIACEDTRRTGQLLHSLNITYTKLVSYFDANETERAEELIHKIQNEQLTLALVSDAGTPGIADPGYRLIKRAHELKIPVSPIPGPSTLSALISVSGLPSDRVLFVGFLPRKASDLSKDIQVWKQARASILAFEAANRLCESLEILKTQIPHAQICIGRELTKTFEEVRLFSIDEALLWAQSHTHLKGELALMLDLNESEAHEVNWDRVMEKAKFLRERGLSVKDTVAFFADEVPNKKELYKRLTE